MRSLPNSVTGQPPAELLPFYKSFLDGVDFTEADISGCKFIHTSMKQCRIKRKQLAGIELDEQAENEICIME